MRSDIKVKIMPVSDDFKLPTKGSAYAIAYDLYSTVDATICVGESVTIPSGFALSMPIGIGAYIIPRSGLGVKHGIVIKNGTGLIDPDYRGEVGIALYNRGERFFKIEKGDRIAQMYFAEVPLTELVITDNLDESVRDIGGFGSTGGYRS